jgi:hypothetical protein
MLSYLRPDLMLEYLKQTKQVFVWLVWVNATLTINLF